MAFITHLSQIQPTGSHNPIMEISHHFHGNKLLCQNMGLAFNKDFLNREEIVAWASCWKIIWLHLEIKWLKGTAAIYSLYLRYYSGISAFKQMRLVTSLHIVSTCLLMALLTFPLDMIFITEGNKTQGWCRSLKVRCSPHPSPPALPYSVPDNIHLREWSSKATLLICLTVCTWAYM